MKIPSLSFLFVFSIIVTVHSQPPAGTYAETASQLLNNAVDREQCIGISAGFSILGNTRWEDGAGYRDKDAKSPFEPATLNRIASISKPFTAVAVLQLYEQGKIELDQPVRTYLPEFPEKNKGIVTVRHLLEHSSGIGSYASNKEQENRKHYDSLNDAVGIFKDRELAFDPGTGFQYTTYGYVVLGRLIEQVSGMSYEAYLKENIWEKAGMTQTSVEWSGREYDGKATLYHRNDKGKIREAKPTDLSDRIPGGGIQSTVTDILRFGDALLDHRLLKESTLEMMWKDTGLKKEGNAYGMGWYLYGENPKYGNVVGHTGGQTGVSAMFMLLPEQQTTIIVLSNTSGAMQEVSNVAVQLFDVAAVAKKGD